MKIENPLEFAFEEIKQTTGSLFNQLQSLAELEAAIKFKEIASIKIETEWSALCRSFESVLILNDRWVRIRHNDQRYIVDASQMSQDLVALPELRIAAIMKFLTGE